MTEEEWLSAKNPLDLLMYAKRTTPTLRGQAGRRKFRLFAVGCIRRVWPALRQVAQRSAVEVAEQFADGDGTPTDLWNAWTKAGQSFPGTENKPLMNALFCVCNNETWEAVKVWRLTSGAEFNAVRQNSPAEEKQQLADLTRDIFGNPFRTVAFDPAWRTSDVVALAEGIYADHAFDRMPILADALQDAGCDNANVLMHCREGSVHARGCWVVDLILGKV
ncbi:hypothetical protein [Gemmata palustris]|uniref:hypothetical protein n=1 Tax=Gemmata palustris TaxID=2822762 RepID=UPI001FECA3B2|nr:hypothetical protein [Gemmata palustris]